MKESKKKCDLKSCAFCKSCLPEWLQAIDCTRRTFVFKKGEQLFAEGDKVRGIYYVNEGIVKVHRKWGDGKELIVRFAGKGDIVGHRGLSKNNIYPIAATAIEAVAACFIDIDFFISSLKVNQQLLYNLVLFFADELQESEKKMGNLANMPVKGRILQCLMTLQSKFGCNDQGFINIELSKQDLASYIGTTYETFFRIMNELAEENLLETEGKRIRLLSA